MARTKAKGRQASDPMSNRQKRNKQRHRRPRHSGKSHEDNHGESSREKDSRGENYRLTVKSNPLFEAYYSGLGLVPEGEWEQFMDTLRKPLPVTFRITGFRGQSQELLKIVKGKYFNELMNANGQTTATEPMVTDGQVSAEEQTATKNGETEQTMQTSVDEPTASNADGKTELTRGEQTSVDEQTAENETSDAATPAASEPIIPICLQWYPNELAWQINLSRKDVRRNVHLQKLKEFLLNETESGNISRQEAVSMIPPMVLDVKPHHKVLDMCAAPGSKTAQIIEYLHAAEGNKEPEGFVIANDVDNKRCYLMVHQVKRLQSPCCAVINHDAAVLPNLRFMDDMNEFVQYDRVLCDVPCSGDGTLRKNFDIWDKWNCKSGGNLHWQQIRILKRGLELLSVGGRLVYSTCSFNPVEDEAVINTAIKQCEGSVELVDVSDQLPGLKYVPGLLSWKIMAQENKWYDTFDQAKEDKAKQIAPSMFPPSLSEAKERNLDRCIRVLPHHQDTGGFFIAVLQKTQQLPWLKPRESVKSPPAPVKTETEKNPEEGASNVTGEKRKLEDDGTDPGDNQVPEKKAKEQRRLEKKTHGYKEDPFLFLGKDDSIWPPIQNFYGIPSDFDHRQILYRTDTGKIRTLYYVSSAIKNLVTRNCDRVKFVNTGVKVFGRSPSPLVPDCEFRINQEGLGAIGHLMQSRTVQFSKKDMVTLLTQENPFLDRLTTAGKETVKKISPGSMIFKFSPSSGPDGDEEPACGVTVCGWRGKTSIRSFVAKTDRTHILRLFGLELSEILKQQAEEREARKKAESLVAMETELPDVSDSELMAEVDTEQNVQTVDEEKDVLND